MIVDVLYTLGVGVLFAVSIVTIGGGLAWACDRLNIEREWIGTVGFVLFICFIVGIILRGVFGI